MFKTRQRVLRELLRYYVALRISAAAATPSAMSLAWDNGPAPVVRYQPARTQGGFDRREIIRDTAGREYVICADDVKRSASFHAN